MKLYQQIWDKLLEGPATADDLLEDTSAKTVQTIHSTVRRMRKDLGYKIVSEGFAGSRRGQTRYVAYKEAR